MKTCSFIIKWNSTVKIETKSDILIKISPISANQSKSNSFKIQIFSLNEFWQIFAYLILD